MGVFFQIVSTAIISIVGINMGLVMIWPASTIIIFASEETVLNRPMTETEISLLGSLSSIGAMISTLTAGFMLDKLGRKKCTIVIAATLVLFWIVLAVSKQVEVVLTCIFLSGLSSSLFLIASVYISEICQESIRGSMTAGNMVTFSLGMLLIYGLGGYVSYDVLIYIGLGMTLVGMLPLFFLRDSPIYLMQKGREEEAAQAIAFLRGSTVDSKEVSEEICTLKSALNPELEDMTPENEKLNPEMKPAEKLSFWKFMKKSQSSRRALFVDLVLLTTSLFQGVAFVQMYLQMLFMDAIPAIPPMLCGLIMSVVGIIAGGLGAYLTDAIGRRPLMVHGSIASGICCIVLGTQYQLQWGPLWVTGLFLYMFPIVSMLGPSTVPTVLMAEFFLPEVKSILSMVVLEWSWFCSSILIFIYNPMLGALGWGPIFYIFAAICFLTAIFCFFFLPETKGLTVEEIQVLFTKKKNRSHA